MWAEARLDTHTHKWQEEALHSYERERRPVAVANTALSIANWEQTLLVRQNCALSHGHVNAKWCGLVSAADPTVTHGGVHGGYRCHACLRCHRIQLYCWQLPSQYGHVTLLQSWPSSSSQRRVSSQ